MRTLDKTHDLRNAFSCLLCFLQLRRLSESGMPIELDAIICVIDAVNFPVRHAQRVHTRDDDASRSD